MTEPNTLRAAFDAVVEGLDLSAVLFTTYAFDAEFFESNVLPHLSSVDRVETLLELHAASEDAARRGVVVVHDGRALSSLNKRATYPTVPVILNGGVFHPKLVAAVGRNSGNEVVVRLLVSSANLTFAGWGHNRECVVACTVTDEGTAGPLLALLDWLQDKLTTDVLATLTPLREALTTLADVPSGGLPRLELTLPGGAALLPQLASNDRRITLAVPYLSSTLPIADELQPHRLRLVLAPDRDGRVDLTAEELQGLRDRGVELHDLEGRTEERRDHLKLLYAGDQLWVGSHNISRAVLGGLSEPPSNVEASLVVRAPAFPYRTFARDDWLPNPEAGNNPELAGLETPPAIVRVTVDWKDSQWRIEVDKAPEDAWLHLPGLEARLPCKTASLRLTNVDAVANALVSRRAFGVWDLASSATLLAEGLVHEIGWREARPHGRFTSLADCLGAWRRRELPRPDAGRPNVRPIGRVEGGDLDDEGILDLHVADGRILDTYFSLFRALRGLRETFMQAKQDVERLRLLDRAPGSLREALEHLEDGESDAPDDAVFRFVVVHELAKLAQELAASLPNDGSELQQIATELVDAFQVLTATEDSAAWLHAHPDEAPELQYLLTQLGYVR